MRLSWNEMRARAAEFAREWRDAAYEKGETQSFYNDFFAIFGVKRRSVANYETRVRRLNDTAGFIDLFMPKVLLVEQKSAGRDLARAHIQAEEYFLAIPEPQRPRYILASDFQTFDLRDLDTGETITFPLADLPRHIDKFGFVLGAKRHSFKDQDPVNIKAAELVGRLHDELEASGFTGHDLERFLVRIVFCLFADDTGVFEPRNLFLDFIEQRTAEDGGDLGGKLAELFQTLNTPEDARFRNLDEDLAAFPYVNGELFSGVTRIPHFNSDMRAALIDAALFDWSPISPAIFGSLFQSVMDARERRAVGAHYTTEKNILKVIGPLFMDDLRAEFDHACGLKRGRTQVLEAIHLKLASLRIFDPACGCGNFLIIAYRELRRLEIDLLKQLRAGDQLELDAARLSRIDVDRFYGVELGEFPAEIARAAMWMMDHIMNNELSLAFGHNYARIPLRAAPHIRHADALELDWEAVLPPEDCSYILGNPPFIGAKFQTPAQREQVRRIAGLGGSGGTLDYVTAWVLKAGAYVNRTEKPIRIGFVATNSITQGEQVAQLWPLVFERCRLEIAFAHRTFAWGSDARGKAHVHVVIIGLAKHDDEPEAKRLFSYPDINGEPEETRCPALSPYLVNAGGLADRHLVVEETSRALNGLPRLLSGSQPIDAGNYIFDEPARAEFLRSEPGAERFMRPYVGAEEYINGRRRWILALQNASPQEIRELPRVVERMQAVRAFRRLSQRSSTLAIADSPAKYNVEVIPTAPFLVIPEVSSERRDYAPIGWLAPPVVPSNLVRIVENATLPMFAVLTSAMHMSWLRHVGGRLKSDYRYAIGLVYNTFPMPPLDAKAEAALSATGQAILDARAAHPGATLADLYDPDTMPADLRAAHRANDRAVDRLYRARRFESERERVEHLFALYEAMRARALVD
ncbi:class I SAM-dependent DNA methyltransferase [bacterium]|nr:class I SAM-dependent DNA methyltransferase [bacterium]